MRWVPSQPPLSVNSSTWGYCFVPILGRFGPELPGKVTTGASRECHDLGAISLCRVIDKGDSEMKLNDNGYISDRVLLVWTVASMLVPVVIALVS